MAEKTKKVVKASYTVYTRVNIQVGVAVEADSLEDAVAASRKFTVTDILDFQGHDFLDGDDLVIEGVFKN